MIKTMRLKGEGGVEGRKVFLTACFINAVSSAEYVRQHLVQINFLIYQIPGLSSIEFLQKPSVKPVVLIVTTADSEFAVQGFELEVSDNLSNPSLLHGFQKPALTLRISLN